MSNQIQSNTTLIVSASPHIRDVESIPRIMWAVVFSLIPAGVAGIFTFGYYCLYVVFLSCIAAVVAEIFILLLRKQPIVNTIKDGSAVVTGILLAYTLPPSVPWYVPVVGSFFAITIVKHAFGGLGNNIWNPALAARAFLQVAYPAVINSDWRVLQHGIGNLVHSITKVDPEGKLVDAITRATPLAKEAGAETYRLTQLLMGNVPGCIGETSVIALSLGGSYLIYRHCVKWYVPVCYIATVFVMVLILPSRIVMPWANDPFYHIFAGGLFLGAFFMATDMVTSPLTKRGLFIFAVGAGVLTVLIRLYSGYPEGVCYSILLMNTATPLIDRFTKPRLYGTSVKKV
ncbi:RnfABCDGE type electron transport complex subunit D [Candidatus Brocadia sinica]|uniref:Ion-translocating oxidoreductase complex subunit D n=1 Tax=Candidatus Brocadia sinica JPN1 TaxID=1197129 RepID=A0ABQ0JYL1_9BACT|nr:RnfABCDGE type electron transport complex subunit D [Candidatus Brocadia sinica]MBL1170442.1 RnfABCDGE type electron transport complex subunit D [Candidatus Brocadia sp. AMX1]NOG40326.1 RnfABCDGE type electron transport complex subunit D [Planctomycetota bacterium]GAN33832.1 NADH:ubiquinone oxidoreductase subunit D [Candidatus Brocadia sinica JPN1]GIK14921.1 MAG: electron transport complex subunit D [Candidatus Brocadia sinica]GJQ18715.1 MAG: electron transport complex subunit D [Candidatus